MGEEGQQLARARRGEQELLRVGLVCITHERGVAGEREGLLRRRDGDGVRALVVVVADGGRALPAQACTIGVDVGHRGSDSPVRQRGQQCRRHEQQDGGHQEQGYDQLDLRRGLGGVLEPALGGAGAGSGRLRAQRGFERRAVALGARERGGELVDALGGRSRLEFSERGGERDA